MSRLLALLVLALACLPGCAASRQNAGLPAAATFTIPAERYAEAFEVARDEIVRRRFEIERVDASAGVIVSRPKTGAGLLAPWTLAPGARVVEDTLNAQTRVIEIGFQAAEAVAEAPQGTPSALAEPRPSVPPARAEGTVIVSVRVLVNRRVSPAHRLDPTAIRYSLSAIDPSLFQRGLSTRYDAPRDLDGRAAAQLARSIRRRLADDSGRRDADGGAAHQRGPSADAQLAMQ